MNNKAKFSLFLAFFLEIAVASMLSAGAQTKFNSENLVLDSATEKYIKKEITGSIGNLITANTKQLVGVSNWVGNQLNDYQTLLFDRITIRYSAHADAGMEAKLAYATSLPVELLNGEFVIKQGGKEILRLPMSAINNNHVSTNVEESYLDLGKIVFLKDASTIEMAIELADGVSLAAGTHHYIYVGLNGYSTKEK
jgi:hypothetical protein